MPGINFCHVAACALLLLAVGVRAQAQTPYTFTRIADSTADGFMPFNFGLPSINDAGQVVFKARRAGDGVTGIFRSDGVAGGPLTTIIDDSSGGITFLGNRPSISNDGAVAIPAFVSGGAAIYRGSGGPITTIADTSGHFQGFGFQPFMNNHGTVAWRGTLDNGDQGLFTGDGDPEKTVFLSSTSQFGNVSSSPSINDNGQIAFEAALDAGGRGIFRYDPGTGDFITIATSAVGSLADDPIINASGHVAFHALPEAIYFSDGQSLTTIADTSGAFLSFHSPAMNDAGQIAFSADLDIGRSGLFDGPDPEKNLVLLGGEFDDGLLFGIFMGREGLNNAGQMTFLAQFGGGRAAIYVATPIPEPGSLALLGPAGLVLLRRRR